MITHLYLVGKKVLAYEFPTQAAADTFAMSCGMQHLKTIPLPAAQALKTLEPSHVSSR